MSDIYSLGVVLYELLTGKQPFDIANKSPMEAERTIAAGEPAKPSLGMKLDQRASAAKLDALCLTSISKDPRMRYSSAAALIRDIDHYLHDQPLEPRSGLLYAGVASYLRRNFRRLAGAAALLIVAAALWIMLGARNRARGPTPSRIVAVLPFRNTSVDHNSDFLSQAIADEISRNLGYARPLTVRPAEAGRKFTGQNIDVQKAGRELRAGTIVSGSFLNAAGQLQVAINMMDVESGHSLWSDVFDVPSGNLVAMQGLIASKIRRAMAPALAAEFVSNHAPQPKNEEAYQLYLRAAALPSEISTNPETRKRALAMLDRSVALDPSYAPVWELLSGWNAADGWFGTGGEAALDRWRALVDKAADLDPDNVVFRADVLYLRSSASQREKKGGLNRGEAYRQLQELLRRRPDSARVHFMLSWLLRDAGELGEAARECDASVLIDARDAGARSCAVTFMLLGDYPRALDYLGLDPESEMAKAVSIDVLLRQRKPAEALRAPAIDALQWGGYPMLATYLARRPSAETKALAARLQPAADPEVNYFSATHLAYVDQPEAALSMLKRSIESGYCAYPAMDSDPMLVGIRTSAGYAALRSSAIECRNKFQMDRDRTGARQ